MATRRDLEKLALALSAGGVMPRIVVLDDDSDGTNNDLLEDFLGWAPGRHGQVGSLKGETVTFLAPTTREGENIKPVVVTGKIREVGYDGWFWRHPYADLKKSKSKSTKVFLEDAVAMACHDREVVFVWDEQHREELYRLLQQVVSPTGASNARLEAEVAELRKSAKKEAEKFAAFQARLLKALEKGGLSISEEPPAASAGSSSEKAASSASSEKAASAKAPKRRKRVESPEEQDVRYAKKLVVQRFHRAADVIAAISPPPQGGKGVQNAATELAVREAALQECRAARREMSPEDREATKADMRAREEMRTDARNSLRGAANDLLVDGTTVNFENLLEEWLDADQELADWITRQRRGSRKGTKGWDALVAHARDIRANAKSAVVVGEVAPSPIRSGEDGEDGDEAQAAGNG